MVGQKEFGRLCKLLQSVAAKRDATLAEQFKRVDDPCGGVNLLLMGACAARHHRARV